MGFELDALTFALILAGAFTAGAIGVTTLADVAMSYVVHASATPRLAVSTATLTVNFLSGVRLGDWLEAAPRIDRMGRALAHTSGAIRRGDEVVATMLGVFSHRPPG